MSGELANRTPERAHGTIVHWGERAYVQGVFPGAPDEDGVTLLNSVSDTFPVARGRVRNGVATFPVIGSLSSEVDARFQLVRHDRVTFTVHRVAQGESDKAGDWPDYRTADRADVFARLFHDMVTVMQSAWIEWRHGAGSEEAMQWIENQLGPPGILPEGDWSTDAQAWHDANRSDPFPQCRCGRPSNILSGGAGYCSRQCETQGKADAATP